MKNSNTPATAYDNQKQNTMKTKIPTLSINSLIDKMYDEKLTSAQVVDKADQAFRKYYQDEIQVIDYSTPEQVAFSIEGLKTTLAFALEHIIALRNQLGVYEEIKHDAENDITTLGDINEQQGIY